MRCGIGQGVSHEEGYCGWCEGWVFGVVEKKKVKVKETET